MNDSKKIPRLRSIKSIINAIRQEDPESSITEGFLRKLIDNGSVRSIKNGDRNKILVYYDDFIEYINSS